LFGLFVFLAGMAATVAAGAGGTTAAGVAEVAAGLETPTSAGFGDCFEHALTASNVARIAKLAIIASFCWRDQDEDDSVVPEIVLLVVWLAGSRLADF
jgi:hypothetical protein